SSNFSRSSAIEDYLLRDYCPCQPIVNPEFCNHCKVRSEAVETFAVAILSETARLDKSDAAPTPLDHRRHFLSDKF
ncbi:MAG TPA: hypothetical protein VFW23_10290, partial [Tepidisphaeraceae bacterium]|nr:hypothetical protein [Tepidisphaeraceae bacterium]